GLPGGLRPAGAGRLLPRPRTGPHRGGAHRRRPRPLPGPRGVRSGVLRRVRARGRAAADLLAGLQPVHLPRAGADGADRADRGPAPAGGRRPPGGIGVTAPGGSSPGFNRLAAEASAYLRQHARNPVDWYPWSPEAFAAARALDRPIFLSIGYSACHWCHVMAHESFEDRDIAAYLNENFVSIK